MQQIDLSAAMPVSQTVLTQLDAEAEGSAKRLARPIALQSASETASELGPAPSASPQLAGVPQHVARSSETPATSHPVSSQRAEAADVL